jgi:DNA-directed RNA polymerase specialized sigma24 family protein
MIEEETKKRLLYYISLLPKEKRDVIKWHYYQWLRYREMAELWWISEDTLVTRAHDARKKLLKLMTQDQK